MPVSSSPSSSATASQSQSQSHQTMKIKRRLYFGYGSNLWREQMALRCPKAEFLGIARLRGYRWMINERGYANVAEVIPGLEVWDPDHDSTGTGPNQSTFEGEVQVKDGGESTSNSLVADNEKETQDDNVNDRHHDNDDHENSVWGAVYSLTSSDEAALDINEGVPWAYEKRDISGIEFWSADIPLPSSKSVTPILTNISSGARYHHLHGNKDKHSGVRGKTPEIVDMLVYIDFKRNDGEGYMPREEYIHRMNMGIIDALEAGVPRGYVERVLRKWIPEEEEHSVDDWEGEEGKKNKEAMKKSNARELALSQARAFKDESGVIPSSGDDN